MQRWRQLNLSHSLSLTHTHTHTHTQLHVSAHHDHPRDVLAVLHVGRADWVIHIRDCVTGGVGMLTVRRVPLVRIRTGETLKGWRGGDAAVALWLNLTEQCWELSCEQRGAAGGDSSPCGLKAALTDEQPILLVRNQVTDDFMVKKDFWLVWFYLQGRNHPPGGPQGGSELLGPLFFF